jgi:hypothetical protein
MALEYILQASRLHLDESTKRLLLETLTDPYERDDTGPHVRFAISNGYVTATARYSADFSEGTVAGRRFVDHSAAITFRQNKFESEMADVEMLHCVNALLRYTDSDLVFYFIESTEAHLARIDGRLYVHLDDDPRAFSHYLRRTGLIELRYEEIPLPLSFD